MAIKKNKAEVKMNKLVYIDLLILDTGKIVMYDIQNQSKRTG